MRRPQTASPGGGVPEGTDRPRRRDMASDDRALCSDGVGREQPLDRIADYLTVRTFRR